MSDENASTSAEGNASRVDTHGAVVVGFDGSEHARRALQWAIHEAQLRDAPLIPAVVVPPLVSLPELPNDAALNAADQLVQEAAQLAREQAPELRTTPVTGVSSPARGLIQLAEDAQLMVLGARGRGGVVSMILGSVSLRVAQRAACPTVVVPAGAEPGDKHRIVVGIDGSPQSEAALAFAVTEAGLRDASVVVVHSVADIYLGSGSIPPDQDVVRAREAAGTRLLHEYLEPWRRKHPEIDIADVLTFEPAETTLPTRSTDADMLVVGTRGRGAFTGMFLGSVSHAALHASTVPVVLVHAEPTTTH